MQFYLQDNHLHYLQYNILLTTFTLKFYLLVTPQILILTLFMHALLTIHILEYNHTNEITVRSFTNALLIKDKLHVNIKVTKMLHFILYMARANDKYEIKCKST